MTETLFEQFGGTYTKQGDYLLPNLALPAEKEVRLKRRGDACIS